MKKAILYIFSAAFLVISSCQKVPVTGRNQFAVIPSSQLLSLSKDSYNQILQEGELSDNQSYINSVTTVGNRIVPAVRKYLSQDGNLERIEGYEWEFNVLESEQLNAFCMPGGKIAFYEGIMPVAQNDAGVAVVMGHEIAHAVADHANERMSQTLAAQLGGVALSTALREKPQVTQQLAMAAFGLGVQVGVLLPYSRLHESEADQMGLYFMAMAGYNPQEAPEFWKRMQAESKGETPPAILATHPHPEDRIEALQEYMPTAMKYYNQTAAAGQ